MSTKLRTSSPANVNTMSAEVVSISDYNKAMSDLLKEVKTRKFDCIVSLKRSGWILGAFLSNQTGKQVFTVSEIKSIPQKFTNVLVVDDKICTGKSLRKVTNKLKSKHFITACLFVEGNVFPDLYYYYTGRIVKMWYEYHFY